MITYKSAGVNIDAGNLLVKRLKKSMPAIGGFSGLFPLVDIKKYREPVLVCATDGVGTKLKLAGICGKHDTVGIDLVAMSVNDIVTTGAKPLLFLDYFATGKLDVKVAEAVIKGIRNGCRQAGCSLIGGETAEMPGFYKKGEYDIAGFCVGIVDRRRVVDGSGIKKGDSIIGLPSSGVHSNGYSLVRKALSQGQLKKYGSQLLKPTKIYVKDVLKVLAGAKLKGICHITGGGFYENITRIMPQGTGIEIIKKSWKVPAVFEIIKKAGGIGEKEMYRTFNMGIGMALIAARPQEQKVLSLAKGAKVIGRVTGEKGVKLV